jgi:hypothetical protein
VAVLDLVHGLKVTVWLNTQHVNLCIMVATLARIRAVPPIIPCIIAKSRAMPPPADWFPGTRRGSR